MNQKRFKNGIDVIDLKTNASDASVLQNTFTKAQWGNVSLLNKRQAPYSNQVRRSSETYCINTSESKIGHIFFYSIYLYK